MSDESDDSPNEILAEVKAAKAHGKAAKARGKTATRGTKSWPIARIGLAAGIGSAAIAAAVLFAGRGQGDK